MKKQIFRVVAFMAAAFLFSTAVALGAAAFASDNEDSPCVPKDAYTETINHLAVTHVVHHEAVAATPDLWWNWSPNKNQGPFDGPPSFPVDARGTWQGPHENGGPDQDTFGTFNSSHGQSGNVSWFHREHGTAEVAAYDETVVDHEASVETVDHSAVTCTTDPTTAPTPDPVADPIPTATIGTPPVHLVAKGKTKPVTPTVVHAGIGSLPNTGGPNWALGGVAGLMILFGAVLVVLGKRVRD